MGELRLGRDRVGRPADRGDPSCLGDSLEEVSAVLDDVVEDSEAVFIPENAAFLP